MESEKRNKDVKRVSVERVVYIIFTRFRDTILWTKFIFVMKRVCERCFLVAIINKRIEGKVYTFNYFDFYIEVPSREEYIYFEWLLNDIIQASGYKIIGIVHEWVPLFIIAPRKVHLTPLRLPPPALPFGVFCSEGHEA